MLYEVITSDSKTTGSHRLFHFSFDFKFQSVSLNAHSSFSRLDGNSSIHKIKSVYLKKVFSILRYFSPYSKLSCISEVVKNPDPWLKNVVTGRT